MSVLRGRAWAHKLLPAGVAGQVRRSIKEFVVPHTHTHTHTISLPHRQDCVEPAPHFLSVGLFCFYSRSGVDGLGFRFPSMLNLLI